ncbi:hypothetical protein ABZU76_19620 [Amycolatopsis sp. NPDC005232]|uniref:hypothetical protein n=1 Tax=Amycolatopsis sp. NPDC005232 TaxID=3157027 RepID=UPI0033A9E1F9
MSLADEVYDFLKIQQADGKLIMPAELVRRVKSGPGPGSLGHAQAAGAQQVTEQQGIEADTLAIVGRLESAWSGASGDAARAGLRPLADVATSASVAMHDSQNALTDQAHAFQSTRDSMQDVPDRPPSKDLLDTVSPWDTDTEDQINKDNAAIAQNKQIYQSFTTTSDGHAQKMPIDYGQVPDAPGGSYAVQHPTTQQSTGTGHSGSSRSSVGPGVGSSAGGPAGTFSAPGSSSSSQNNQGVSHYSPAASADGGTETAGYVPPTAPGGPPSSGGTFGPGFGPTGSGGQNVSGPTGGYGQGGGFVPGFPGGAGSGPGGPGGPEAGVRGNFPGEGVLGGTRGPGSPGNSSGAGRLGAVNEPGTAGTAGSAGQRGANGMPMGAGGGKGQKEEDKEKKSAAYLREADPNALFGYDGKATPPVIGK